MDRKEFLWQRRNRCVGRLLGELEGSIFPSLSESEKKAVQSIVKRHVGNYHYDALEALSMDDETRINEVTLT